MFDPKTYTPQLQKSLTASSILLERTVVTRQFASKSNSKSKDEQSYRPDAAVAAVDGSQTIRTTSTRDRSDRTMDPGSNDNLNTGL